MPINPEPIPSDRADHLRHISSPSTGNTLCGRENAVGKAFEGIDHAYRNVIEGGPFSACRDCVTIVSAVLAEER